MDETPILLQLRSALSEQMISHSKESNSKAKSLLDTLIKDEIPLDLIESCDLLERACASGNLPVVMSLCDYVDFFVYRSFALVLALRSGHSDVARWLIEHEGVDLLAPIQRPAQMSVMLPPDTTFTRSALTKSSTYLFLNPLDPTPSSFILRPYTGFEQLLGSTYSTEFDMQKAAEAIHEIVGDGLVDATVFVDIFRAYVVCAARKFRDRRSIQDLQEGEICLKEASFMLRLHETQLDKSAFGDERLYDILASLIVPRCPEEIYFFMAYLAPEVFLAKLTELEWLQEEIESILPLVPILKPSSVPEHNATLLGILSKFNRIDEVKLLEDWSDCIDEQGWDRAIEFACEREYVEMSTYLLFCKMQHAKTGLTSVHPVDDLQNILLL